MSIKRTILFAAVLFLILAVYFVTVRRPVFLSGRDFSLSRGTARANVLALDPKESVKRLSIHDSASQSELVLERLGERVWQMVSPVRYPAESLVASGMLALLKTMPRNRSIPLSGAGSSELGFDTPRVTVCVVTEPHGKERCLEIGKPAAVGEGAYARWRNEQEYFLVSKNFVESFHKTAYGMRKKQVFAFSDSAVDFIRYRTASGDFELKAENQKWALARPIRWAPSGERVQALITELSTLFVKEFLDEAKTDDPEFGFGSSEARALRVQLRDRSKQTIVVGRAAAGKDAYYVKLSDPSAVVLAARGKIDKIDRLFEALSR